MSLKPPRLNTQGPVEDFLRQVYRWSLEVDSEIETLEDGAGVAAHASTHIHDGTDEIDGDKLDVNFSPSNYTPATVGGLTTSTEELTSHLKGIDTRLGGSPATHASTHIRSGSDELDGDLVDIDLVPTNYTRTTDGTATNAEHLRAHLNGIDAALLLAKTTMYTGRLTGGGNTANAAFYMTPVGETASTTTTITDAQMAWGRAGTIKNFRAKHLTSSGDADTWDLTVNINGSDTTLTLTGMSGTNTAWFRDTTHTVSIAVEDLIVIKKQNGVNQVLTGDLVYCFDFVEP